jgi:hypothetical protein
MDAELQYFVDLVLRDLHRRDGMFVGRRTDESDPSTLVIQTGEEGRHRVHMPGRSPAELTRFMASAQEYVSVTLGRPVPCCPQHDHALRPCCAGNQVGWECPEGEWRCRVGDYEEEAWPLELESGMAAALSARLGRRGLDGWAGLSVEDREGEQIARVRLRAADPELERAISAAAQPLAVSFVVADWPIPRRV